MVRFELAGRYKDGEYVFLTSKHRKYKKQNTIYHRSDYHTIVEMDEEVFKNNFIFSRHTHIYRSPTRITWGRLREVADIKTYKID